MLCQPICRSLGQFVAMLTTAVLGLSFLSAYAQRPDRVLFPVPTPGAQSGKPVPLPWRVLDPISFENLQVFPVVARTGYDTSAFVTLDEALATGDVVVAESGGARGGGAQVNQLVLVHRGKRPLLLLAGEVVTGGKQDRVIGKDRIVAPGAEPLPLDVFCVERGRWSGAKAEFSESKFMAHPSVREKAVVDKAQDQVWAAVRSGTTAASTITVEGAPAGSAAPTPAAPARISREALNMAAQEAGTEAYAKIYAARGVAGSVESFSEEIARRFRNATSGLREEQLVGVVVAYNGEAAWSDLFASNMLFERYWPKLLRSYVVEAMARPLYRRQAAVAEARDFLAPMSGREVIESEPGVYRWREIAAGRYAQIELDSLLGRTFTLHRVKIQRTS